jgi:hypothetical protein
MRIGTFFFISLNFQIMKTRRKSAAIIAAQDRLSGLMNIDPIIDLGNGLSAQSYQDKIEMTEAKLNAYVNAVAKADAARAMLIDAEKELSDFSDHIMRGVSVKFGMNSAEYVSVGGTRKKDRKRPIRKNMSSPISNENEG